TLGFFVTIDGALPPNNIGFVTCRHVLDGAGLGDNVYQPQWVWEDKQDKPWFEGDIGIPLLVPRNQTDLVGKTLRWAEKANDSNDYYVDAAVVKLDIRFSSCCHSSIGVCFPEKGDIIGLDKANDNINFKGDGIVGVRALTSSDVATNADN